MRRDSAEEPQQKSKTRSRMINEGVQGVEIKVEADPKNNKDDDPHQQPQGLSEDDILYFDQIQTDQLIGFNILGEDSSNQILQVSLYPKEKVYIRGQILYANFDWKKRYLNEIYGYDSALNFFSELYYTNLNPMRKVHNKTKYMGYFALSKGQKAGRFLVIDSNAYGNDMYFRPSSVVLSNLACENSKKKNHESLSSLEKRYKKKDADKLSKKTQKLKKAQAVRTVSVLQSNNGNIFIQKYLGADQKFYTNEMNIVCMSGTVKANSPVAGVQPIKLQGPGWVFLENKNRSLGIELSKKTLFLLFLLIFVGFIHLIDIFTDVVEPAE